MLCEKTRLEKVSLAWDRARSDDVWPKCIQQDYKRLKAAQARAFRSDQRWMAVAVKVVVAVMVVVVKVW